MTGDRNPGSREPRDSQPVDGRCSMDDLLRDGLAAEVSSSNVRSSDREDPFADEAELSSEEMLAASMGCATPVEQARVLDLLGGPKPEFTGADFSQGPRAGSSSTGKGGVVRAASLAAAILIAGLAVLGVMEDSERGAIAALDRGDYAVAEAWLIARGVGDGVGDAKKGPERPGDGPLWTAGSSPTRSADSALAPIRILTPRNRVLSSQPTIRVRQSGLAEGISLSAVVEDLEGRVWLQTDVVGGVVEWSASAGPLDVGRSYRLTVAGPTAHSPRARVVFRVAGSELARDLEATRSEFEARLQDPSLRTFVWAGHLARAGFRGDALVALATLAYGSDRLDGPEPDGGRVGGLADPDAGAGLIAFLRARAATDLATDLSVWGSRTGRR